MRVTLIDYTGAGYADPARHAANVLVFTKNTRLEMRAGMFDDVCRKPWGEIEEELEYMANTIPSSWEFVEYKFLIEDVTRAFTHQFVRTRTGSYAQQTMRVLDKRGWTYSTGPTIQENWKLENTYDEIMSKIDEVYAELIDGGAAIEDARGILPTNINTNIVAKFDLRSIADTARKRASSRTQGEYREVMDAMKKEVIRVHPWSEKFFNRKFDVSAKDLEKEIIKLRNKGVISADHQTRLVKLIDQMRITA